MANNSFKRYTRIGPGGINCPCCAPAPGKARKMFLRAAKRAERDTMKRQLEKEARDE